MTGVIVQLAGTYVFDRDIAGKMYWYLQGGYQNVNRRGQLTVNTWFTWWRFCKEASVSEYENLFVAMKQNMDFLTILQKIQLYAHAYFRWLVTSPVPLTARQTTRSFRHGEVFEDTVVKYVSCLTCNPFVEFFMDAMCLGMAAIAVIGDCYIVITRVSRMLALQQGGQEIRHEDALTLGVTIISVYVHAMSLGSARFGLIFGTIIAFGEVYRFMRHQGLKLARSMGEKILTYSHSQSDPASY